MNRLPVLLACLVLLACVVQVSPADVLARGRRAPVVARRIAEQRWARPVVVAGTRTFASRSFDGHVHTSHSRDARHDPLLVLALAERIDLDGVVLTDHGATGAAEDVRAYRGPVAPLIGAEIGGSFGHAVAWGFSAHRTLHDRPHLALEEVEALVRPQQGVLVLAHPGWWIRGNSLDPRWFMHYDAIRRGGMGGAIDALELWNGTYPTLTPRLVDAWLELLDRRVFVPIVGNSDFHELHGQELGSPRNVVLCPADDRGEPVSPLGSCVLDATREGRSYVTDGPTVAFVVGDRVPGESRPCTEGEELPVRVEATAPAGGTLLVFVGRAEVARVALAPGALEKHELLVRVPTHDTYVWARIDRLRHEPERPPFSLITNPVRIDVPPLLDDWRGRTTRVRPPRSFRRAP